MKLALRDHERHTYADYLSWSDDVRYELIDGEAFLMAPGQNLEHQDIVGEIYFQLMRALEGAPCRPFIAPLDVLLPKQGEENYRVDTVVQPDVLVVCDPTKLERRGVRGAPDFVVEVLSPSTASHDLLRKWRVYERAGVREYWLVHPTDRVVTVYRLHEAAYGKPDIFELAGETPVGILPGVAIVWDGLVSRLSIPED